MIEKGCTSCIHYLPCLEVDELADGPCVHFIDNAALQCSTKEIVDICDVIQEAIVEIQEGIELLRHRVNYIQRELYK